MNKVGVINKILDSETNPSEELSLENIEELPPDIGRLSNLKNLRLSDNKKLTSLPPQIGQLINLEILYLQHCALLTLPAEIGHLTNLKKLNLRGNQLTKLPPEIGELTNLEKLNLSENRLISLPSEIGQLINLKSIYLANNQLTCLPSVISKLNPKDFDAAGNQFIFPPQDVVRKGFSAVQKFFSSENEYSRGQLVITLGQTKDPLTVESLLAALKDEDNNILSFRQVCIASPDLKKFSKHAGFMSPISW